MRARLAFVAILALTFTLALPFTAAAAERSGTADVTAARVAAEQQLISLGINPGDATFQIGARNYAGPNCPGSGWNCTTASTVVQIATGAALASVNKFEQCSTQVCTITQSNSGGTNEARCVEYTSADPGTQTCTITQTNTTGRNRAFVFQWIGQSRPQGAQVAGQRANVSQANGTGVNESALTQTITQHQAMDLSGAATITQTQEAHQRADICQGGAGCSAASSGKNISGVSQFNVQRLGVHFAQGSSGAIVQKQNTDPPADATTTTSSTAVVSQKSVASTNDSGLLQFDRQIASVHDGDEAENENDDDRMSTEGTFAGTVDQQQGVTGNPLCPESGVCGFVVQDSTGVQRAQERQDELQKLQGPPLATQNQYGPEFCCATQTGGNAANVNNVTQVKVQLHTSSVSDGMIQGHCQSSPNACNVKQTLTQNQTTQRNSCTQSPCNPTIVCKTGPSEGGGDFTFCTPSTADGGPLSPPCPSPLCASIGAAPRLSGTTVAWRWSDGRPLTG